MSRTIKFRGKRIDGKGWVYGDLFNSHKEHHSPSVSIASDEFHPVGYGSKTFYEVEPTSIGQFTGLTDKNGKDIYENDVVKWGHLTGYSSESWHRVAHVELFPSLQFKILHYTDGKTLEKTRTDNHVFMYGSFSYKQTNKYLEVIGNATDNPELLNK